MRYSMACVSGPFFTIAMVVGVVLVSVFTGCGSGRDSLTIQGGAVDAPPGTVNSGGGDDSAPSETDGSAGAGGDESGGSGCGGVIEPLSCEGLKTMCGKEGNTSCCSSLLVSGGTYMMGRSENGIDKCPDKVKCEEDEQPEHEATVSDFYLDEFEVTVGRFRKFVEKYDQAGTKPKVGAGAHPKIPDSGWRAEWNSQLPSTSEKLKSALKCHRKNQTWQHTAGSTEQHPINCVNWYVAFAFCAWDGGRLPTEAEWEKAAAGGEENRLYPWGKEAPDKTRAAYEWLYDGNTGQSFADIAKVGMLPDGAGRWDHKDLAGNVWEWVLDGYKDKWYSGEGNTCNDCANHTATSDPSNRVLRGGAFSNKNTSWLRAVFREKRNPQKRNRRWGFRCARDC